MKIWRACGSLIRSSPATSSNATTSHWLTSPGSVFFGVFLPNRFGTVVSPPEIRIAFGESSR